MQAHSTPAAEIASARAAHLAPLTTRSSPSLTTTTPLPASPPRPPCPRPSHPPQFEPRLRRAHLAVPVNPTSSTHPLPCTSRVPNRHNRNPQPILVFVHRSLCYGFLLQLWSETAFTVAILSPMSLTVYWSIALPPSSFPHQPLRLPLLVALSPRRTRRVASGSRRWASSAAPHLHQPVR